MNPIFNGCGPPSIFQPSDARTKVQLHCRSPGRDSSDLWDIVAVATGLGMRVLDIYIYIYEYMYHTADPGRRKGECVREKEFMTQLPGKNNTNSLTPADARGSA